MKEKNIFPVMDAGVFYKDEIWAVQSRDPKLFRINVNTGMMQYVTSFECLPKTVNAIRIIVEYKGKLLFIPGYAECIVVYDIQSGEKKYYDCKNQDGISHFVKFNQYYRKDQYLFLFPGRMKYILKIDLDTMKLEYIDAPIKELEEKYGKVEIAFYKGCMLSSNEILLPTMHDGIVVVFDMEHSSYRIVQTGMRREVVRLAAQEDKIYAQNKEGELFEYCLEAGAKSCFRDGKAYNQIWYKNNGIWLLPLKRHKFARYDVSTKVTEYYEFPENLLIDYSIQDKNSVIAWQAIEANEKLYMLPRYWNMLICIDTKSKQMIYTKLRIEEQWQYLIDGTNYENEPENIYERMEWGLPQYLEKVIQNGKYELEGERV